MSLPEPLEPFGAVDGDIDVEGAHDGVAAGAPTVAAAPPVPDEAVRLALELAFGVAVLGARHRPPLAVPAGLRPFLRFQKLPTAALGPLRRAVEGDAEFRERVASVADESVVGLVGSLWLRRPHGWEAAIADALADGSDVPPVAVHDRRARDDAARVERAERAAARASAELAVAAEALAAERARTAARAADAAALQERLDELERELQAVRLQAEVAQRRAVDADRTRREAETRAAEAAARAEALGPSNADLTARVAAAEAAAAEVAATDPAPASPPEPGRPADLTRRLAPLVDDAAGALAALARALQRIGGELDERGTHASPAAPTGAAPAPPAAAARPPGSAPTRAEPRRPAGPVRESATLPHRMRPESTEAATFLLRRTGAVAVVDGYNVAKTAFTGARSLADERDWLSDVLDELAARLGIDVRVVFDGADVGPVHGRRRAVRVLFSRPGVTADDVVVELASGLPAERPVVVVTNDLALRERVKIYGADVLSAEQLLAVARR